MSDFEPDFDQIVRQTMTDVVDHTQPPSDLADRLIANSREGRVTITPLARARRGARWTTPLLAAAAVVVLAGGAVLTKAALGSSHHHAPPADPSPSVTHLPTKVTSPSPSPTPTHPGFTVQSAYFGDARTGWALGTEKGRAALLRTTDGRTWSSVALPAGLTKPSDSSSCGTNGTVVGPCVDNVLFADAQHGYLWSLHEFYLTSDGGRHWQREAHSPYTGAAELALFGSHVLRMRPIAGCSSGCIGKLQIASIGSDDWTTVTPKTSALYQSHIAVHGTTAYFESGDYAGGKGGGVYRSTDGVHWTSMAARPCGDAYYQLVAGFDGSIAVDCEAATETLRIAAPGSGSFGAGRRLPGHAANIVAVLSAQEVLSIDGPKLYRSTNGGATWTALTPLDINSDFGVVPVVQSPDFAYVPTTDGRHLLVSTDRGLTWQARAF